LIVLRAAVEISFEGGFEIASPQSAQHGIARSHQMFGMNLSLEAWEEVPLLTLN
jgi:hypothetical protein